MPFHPQDTIRRKRDNLPLSDPEIDAFIRAVVSHHVSDAQAAAFLMAVFLRGLSPAELAALTKSMRFSGEVFSADLPGAFTIDKHSTGGVGDKTSLLIAPILAAEGLAHPTPAGLPGILVPMISGRSLGHTGGTLDKLETIPGFQTQLSLADFEQVLRRCGAALIGQTENLVPADRILYALRDHTGTVESPFLITASIMSKKLAESLQALVLDVKVGTGAFMPTYEKSLELARLMVETGNREGTRTVALLTQHDEPLGRFAGNWLEVQECVDILQNRRHPMSQDLLDLTLTLSGWMLHLAGHADTPEHGAHLADQLLHSGAAWQAWLKLVAAQSGDTSIFTNPPAPAAAQTQLLADRDGFLHILDCKQAGWAVQRLGAGRLRPGDPIAPAAGIEIHAKLGDRITRGQPLLTLHADSAAQLREPLEMLAETYRMQPTAPVPQPPVRDIVQP